MAQTHINSDVVEWETHQRGIWLTERECHLQMKGNTSHEQSLVRHNIHTSLPDGIAVSDVYIT